MNLFASKSKETLGHKVAALGAFLAATFVSAAATLLPLNGRSTGEISDKYPNLLLPADISYSITSIIYLFLAAYLIYQFAVIRESQSKVKEPELEVINKYFILSSVLNILWLFAWHFEVLWLSVVLMFGILSCIIKINATIHKSEMSAVDAWLIRAPFSLYFGWVTFAAFANITIWLISIEWDSFGISEGSWMVGTLILISIIGLAAAYRLTEWLYGAVFVWLFAGILLKHLSPDGWDGKYPSVIIALTILLSVWIVAVLYIAEKEYISYKKNK